MVVVVGGIEVHVGRRVVDRDVIFVAAVFICGDASSFGLHDEVEEVFVDSDGRAPGTAWFGDLNFR